MTVKHTLVSLDMRVFALCSLMELHRGKNAALICDFSTIGFVLGAARKLSSTLIILNAGMHLSKSYICWIAIYVALIAVFAVLRKKTAGSALLFAGAAREE